MLNSKKRILLAAAIISLSAILAGCPGKDKTGNDAAKPPAGQATTAPAPSSGDNGAGLEGASLLKTDPGMGALCDRYVEEYMKTAPGSPAGDKVKIKDQCLSAAGEFASNQAALTAFAKPVADNCKAAEGKGQAWLDCFAAESDKAADAARNAAASSK